MTTTAYRPVFSEDRGYGVEFEFKISQSSGSVVASALSRETGIPVIFRGYTHSVTEEWKLVTDASVSGGFELVSPVLFGADGLEQIKKLLAALRTVGARVDKSCGFHVHHSAADLDVDDVMSLLVFNITFDKVLDGFHPVSRRNNQFCYCEDDRPNRELASNMKSTKLEYLKRELFDRSFGLNVNRVRRYRKLNILPFSTYGTVEFRQHAGTLNFEKAENWIIFTQLMVNKAKTGIKLTPRAKVSIGELYRALRMGLGNEKIRSIAKYYIRRTAELKIDGETE